MARYLWKPAKKFGDFANNLFPFVRGKPSNEKTGDKFGLLPNRGGGLISSVFLNSSEV